MDIVRGGQPIAGWSELPDMRQLRGNLLWTLFSTVMAAGIASLLAPLSPFPSSAGSPPHTFAHQGDARHQGCTHYSTKLNIQQTTGQVIWFTLQHDDFRNRYRDSALETLAFFDPLTGLPNQRYFSAILMAYWRVWRSEFRCRPVSTGS